MTDTTLAPRTSFWRETFRAFKEALPFEGRWVVVLAVIAGISIYVVSTSPDMIAVQADLAQKGKSPGENLEKLTKLWKVLGPALAMQMSLFVIAFYSLTALYLRRVAPNSAPQFSPKNFLLWLGTVCLKFLVIVGIAAGVGVLAVLAFAAGHYLGVPKFLLVAGGIFLWLLLVVLGSFASLRLTLTTPLSILRRRPILETSWKITQGSCWRIFRGNLALFFFFFLPVTITVALLEWAAKSVLGATALPNQIIIAALEGLKIGAYLLLSVIYYCTIYRILLQEQHNKPTINIQA